MLVKVDHERVMYLAVAKGYLVIAFTSFKICCLSNREFFLGLMVVLQDLHLLQPHTACSTQLVFLLLTSRILHDLMLSYSRDFPQNNSCGYGNI